MFTAIVVTVSDRSFRGERADASGPAVRDMLEGAGFRVARLVLAPDERAEIERVLIQSAAAADLVVTTGGPAFPPGRDPRGDGGGMPAHGTRHCRGDAALQPSDYPPRGAFRAAAGIRGQSLIVNLPGSPRAARENLEAVIGALPHGIEMLRGGDHPQAPR
jgi:molybdopterin biosynthesis enzyme MoaB